MSLAQISMALFSLALLPFYTTSRSTRDNSRQAYPETIPALREWIGRENQAEEERTIYTFGSASRIVLDPAYSKRLLTTGTVFAADLRMLVRLEVPVVEHEQLSTVREGDILLTLDSSMKELGVEGYRIDITDRVVVSAADEHGVFYGTRTLLQLLKQDRTLRSGSVRDWPGYPERSLMIDVGRKYFSLPWLESHVRELAYLKYNYFHIHLSDAYGFRLQSELHPEIVAPRHYSKEEIRELIELAQTYSITIVPEIDMPSHMHAILEPHPELRLTNSQGVARAGEIDLSQDASYQLMQDILEEFLPLFPGPYWHIGANEYIGQEEYANFPSLLTYAQQHYGPDANARDTYLGFVNWANDIVRSHGKTTRAWGGGLYGGRAVQVAPDIIYEHWLKSSLPPQETVNRRPLLTGESLDESYYVPGLDWQVAADIIYEVFDPRILREQTGNISPHQKNLGARLRLWSDYPERETENQIAEGMMYSLRALAQKNWGSIRLVPDYSSFLPIIVRIGHAPGYAVPLSPEYLTPGQHLNVSITETEELSLDDEEDSQ